MLNDNFESGGRAPNEERMTWIILLVVAILILAGLLAHGIFFPGE